MTSKTSRVSYLGQKTIFFVGIFEFYLVKKCWRKKTLIFLQETPIVKNWTFGPGKNVTFGRKTGTYLAGKLPPFLAGKIKIFGGEAVRRLTRQQLPSSSPAKTCSSWQLPVI
jgi:hypothetical protein